MFRVVKSLPMSTIKYCCHWTTNQNARAFRLKYIVKYDQLRQIGVITQTNFQSIGSSDMEWSEINFATGIYKCHRNEHFKSMQRNGQKPTQYSSAHKILDWTILPKMYTMDYFLIGLFILEPNSGKSCNRNVLQQFCNETDPWTVCLIKN